MNEDEKLLNEEIASQSDVSQVSDDIPAYVDDPNQVGNKIWRLVPGDGIKIVKTTSSSIDTYTFEGNISKEEGNIIEMKDDGLFIPEVTSKVEELTSEIEDLRSKIDNLKKTEYRPTQSITFTKDDESGIDVIKASVNVSADKDNSIEVKADGLFSRSMDVTPGSISDIERRLSLLEDELKVINQDIDNLKTSANIDRDNNLTPPMVVPESEN